MSVEHKYTVFTSIINRGRSQLMSNELIEALCFTLSLPPSLCVDMMSVRDWINESAWHNVFTIISLNGNEILSAPRQYTGMDELHVRQYLWELILFICFSHKKYNYYKRYMYTFIYEHVYRHIYTYFYMISHTNALLINTVRPHDIINKNQCVWPNTLLIICQY